MCALIDWNQENPKLVECINEDIGDSYTVYGLAVWIIKFSALVVANTERCTLYTRE